MPIKIGFINFTAFDMPSPLEMASMKRNTRPIQFPNKVLSLYQSHPDQPGIRPYAPELDATPDKPFYKFMEEMTPLMASFHEHFHDLNVQKDIIRRWQERQNQIQLGQERYERKTDDIHRWMIELLYRRVYERVGRMTSVFRKLRIKDMEETKLFAHEHREKRLEEAEIFPRAYMKALRNPFFYEIKEPNQFKALDFERMKLAMNRRVRTAEDEVLLELRRVFAEEVSNKLFEKKRYDLNLFKTKGRGNIREQRMRLLADYDEAWRHTVQQFDAFRQAVRAGIMEQAEVFPKLHREAIVDPFVPEIKEPNDKDYFEKGQKKIDDMHALVERRARVKQELHHDAVDRKTAGTYQKQEVIHGDHRARDEAHDFESQRQVHHAAASSQGMIYIAGREVPREGFAIQIDLKSTRPLPLGLHGSPRSPEWSLPVPPQNDAYYSNTAGVRSLDGKLFERAPEAAEMASKSHILREHMRSVLGAQNYADQARQEKIKIDPTEAYEKAEELRAHKKKWP